MVKLTILLSLCMMLALRLFFYFSTYDSRLINNDPSTFWLIIRKKIDSIVLKYLPGLSGKIALGITFGGSSKLSKVSTDDFRRVGLSHILAASGFNLTLIASWSTVLLSRFLNKRTALVVSLLNVWIYAGLAGFGASVVRAGLMASLVILAALWGRYTHQLWILLITGYAMLMYNPRYLVDIGFQLSFLATFGLIWTQPKNEFLTSLVAYIWTMPILWHYFGSISLVAVLANVLLGWTVPLIMQLTIFALFFPPIFWIEWPIIQILIQGTKLLAQLPFASLSLPKLSWLGLVLSYLLIVSFTAIYVRKADRTNLA